MKYKGRIITANAPVSNSSSASAIWRLEEQMQGSYASAWPIIITPVVTDSLIFHVDAGNTSSYSGSGTTWTDISPSPHNGTMTNVTYNSSSGGYMSFNGSSSVVTASIPKPSSMPITFDFWINPDSSTPGGLYDTASGNANVLRQYDVGKAEWWNVDPAVTLSLSATTWQHIVLIYNYSSSRTITYYKNASLITTATGSSDSTFAWTTPAFGNINGGSPWYSGKISAIKIYNKALSGTEVTQNYNALKNRYGL